ncbi:DUF6686 family protein [Geofilum rhodophaeum]|uniref:DUF6686 family protein n=1 Tax=Geofilum rhodophaeum TaxID=1965019 RepID=UPI000B525489
MKLVSKTANGQIAYCQYANLFHLEFGNLLITLNTEDLQRFYQYIQSIDEVFFVNHNKESFNHRKLILHLGTESVYFGLTLAEFREFKSLLEFKRHPYIINNSEVIDFVLQLN